MANFGLRDLAVVDCHAPNWREARAAVGAPDVLRKARASSLPEALRGCSLVLGTTDGRRRLRHPVVALPGLLPFARRRLRRGRMAVLFGSEKTGLRNADLQFCHASVRIPTRPDTPSMNLGQAAAVIAYELSRRPAGEAPRAPHEPSPTAEQMEDLLRKALTAFDRLDYMRNTPESAKADRIRRMLRRWNLVRKDAALLQALFKRIALL